MNEGLKDIVSNGNSQSGCTVEWELSLILITMLCSLSLLLLTGSGNMSSAPWPLPQTCTVQSGHVSKLWGQFLSQSTCSACKDVDHASRWLCRNWTCECNIFHEMTDIHQRGVVLSFHRSALRACCNQSQVEMSSTVGYLLSAHSPSDTALIKWLDEWCVWVEPSENLTTLFAVLTTPGRSGQSRRRARMKEKILCMTVQLTTRLMTRHT